MRSDNSKLFALVLGAIGIVFGDIGTSPLYAMRECFYGEHSVPLTPENILGILSLVFWALIIVISLEYVILLMRVDNHGEGGILALMALALNKWHQHPKRHKAIMILGIFGAALFYGDSIITPSISVLSAVEGLEIASPVFNSYLVPLTIVILMSLFFFQHHGTAKVGTFFGPVMCVWFVSLASLGLISLLKEPQVLKAINPLYAVNFFLENRGRGFLVLGAVFLAITGGEALYADMGHFGKRPIRIAWFGFVLPSLLLNYFGQGALLLRNPQAVESPFYHLVPSWGVYPMVVLATLATVIASQAVISGTFSLTRQAVQLGYCPRLKIEHTSEETIGQIYIPAVNWLMLVAIVILVVNFKSSSHLAAAYGIAVTGTMVITTILAFVALRSVWKWHAGVMTLLTVLFLFNDLSFFSANIMKVFQGGWLPLLVAGVLFTFLSTWKRGREVLFERIQPILLPIQDFFDMVDSFPPLRVPGTAIFLTRSLEGTSPALLHNLKHNKVLHERVVFLTILTEDIPYVEDEERLEVREYKNNFYRIIARYGFKEDPNVLRIIELAKKFNLEFEMMETTFFVSRETLVSKRGLHSMPLWQQRLFIGMLRNARSATDFFRIPSNRVIEVGAQIDI